jgi:hypothetical protein
VSGTGFFGADLVSFVAASGAPSNVTATSLKIVVPALAQDGPLMVHTLAGLSPPSAAAFNVLP